MLMKVIRRIVFFFLLWIFNFNYVISCCLFFFWIILGNSDPLFRLESLIKSTDYCENFVVKIIEGAAHWPHQETPLEFNRIILKFLVGEYSWHSLLYFKINQRRILVVVLGSRASQTLEKTEKVNNKGLVGFMLGAVSNSVNKIHNSVHLRATEAF